VLQNVRKFLPGRRPHVTRRRHKPSPAAAWHALIDPAEFPDEAEGNQKVLCQTLRILILNLIDEDNPNDEISRIEARLDELAEVSERCRKIILVSKAAIAGGVALLLVMMLGLFGSSNQVAAIGSIAVLLGGIVSLGSNVSTLRQTMAAMSAAEVLRSDLISKIDLRVVGDRIIKRI
jgi:hypothetical protein